MKYYVKNVTEKNIAIKILPRIIFIFILKRFEYIIMILLILKTSIVI